MKFAVLLGVLAALLQGSTLSAATIYGNHHKGTHVLFVEFDAGDPDFDTFDFHFESSSGTILPPRVHLNGVSTPGEGGTGFNPALITPEFLGGEGLNAYDGQATPDYVTQSWASFGGIVDLPSGFFVGSFETDERTLMVVGQMHMYRFGTLVRTAQEYVYIAPAPTAASLAAMAIAAGPLILRRGRR